MKIYGFSNADAYDRLMVLIIKKTLSKTQRAEANQLIAVLPDYPVTVKESFKNRIDNIPDDAASADDTKLKSDDSNYIEIIDSDGTKKVTATAVYDYVDGNKITVKSNKRLSLSGTGSGNVSPNNNRTQMEIDIKKGESVILSVGIYKFTINGKPKPFKPI